MNTIPLNPDDMNPPGSNAQRLEVRPRGVLEYEQLVQALQRLLKAQDEPERFGCVGPSASDTAYSNLVQLMHTVCMSLNSPNLLMSASAFDALNTDLIRDCERAMAQRDRYLATGIRTGGGDMAWNTCFGYILKQHGIRVVGQ